MANNKENDKLLTLKVGDTEVKPEKFIGILQKDMQRELLTTENFSLEELKDIRHFLLEGVENMMLDKLTGQDRIALKEIQKKREEFEKELMMELQGKKYQVYSRLFLQGDVEKVFDSRELPDEMQEEAKEFIADLLSDVPEEEIEEMDRAYKKEKRRTKIRDNEKVVDLANWKNK